MKAPKNKQHYNPQEKPRRYPLELGKDHHICLWSEDGTFKWTVAYFVKGSEGFDLHFVGDRPLNERVNWDHFRELVAQGQKLADEEFDKGAFDEETFHVKMEPKKGRTWQTMLIESPTFGTFSVNPKDPPRISPKPISGTSGGEAMSEAERPPLGVMPEKLWKEARMHDLIRALYHNYLTNNTDVRRLWIDELRKLIDDLTMGGPFPVPPVQPPWSYPYRAVNPPPDCRTWAAYSTGSPPPKENTNISKNYPQNT